MVAPGRYAQKRTREVFGQWKKPDNFKIEAFVVRVGEWGGRLLVDYDDQLTVHKFCSTYPLRTTGASCNRRRGRRPRRA